MIPERPAKSGVPLLVLLTSIVACPDPAPCAEAEQVEVRRNLPYAQRAEQKLLCDVYLPPGEGPFPGVLCVHGGAWRIGSKQQMVRIGPMLAEAGYVAVAINYRLAPRHTFPAQLEDCRDAARWIRQHAADYKIDPERLGALGYSAGGHLVTLLALTRGKIPGQPPNGEQGAEAPSAAAAEPLEFRAVVAGGAPTDFRQVPENSRTLSYWLGGTRREVPDRYVAASPAEFVAADAPPMFFFHGESDLLVPVEGIKAMVAALEQAGAEAKLHVLPRMGHVATFFHDPAYQQGIEFLDQYLQPQTADAEPQTGDDPSQATPAE